MSPQRGTLCLHLVRSVVPLFRCLSRANIRARPRGDETRWSSASTMSVRCPSKPISLPTWTRPCKNGKIRRAANKSIIQLCPRSDTVIYGHVYRSYLLTDAAAGHQLTEGGLQLSVVYFYANRTCTFALLGFTQQQHAVLRAGGR